MVKLEHGKTYLSKDGERIKVKKINDNLFEGDNGLEYRANGEFIMCPYRFSDLTEETDGTIKHFYKIAKNLLTEKIFSYFDLIIFFSICKFIVFLVERG